MRVSCGYFLYKLSHWKYHVCEAQVKFLCVTGSVASLRFTSNQVRLWVRVVSNMAVRSLVTNTDTLFIVLLQHLSYESAVTSSPSGAGCCLPAATTKNSVWQTFCCCIFFFEVLKLPRAVCVVVHVSKHSWTVLKHWGVCQKVWKLQFYYFFPSCIVKFWLKSCLWNYYGIKVRSLNVHLAITS